MIIAMPLALGGCIVASERPDFDTRLIAPSGSIPKGTQAAPALASPQTCAAGAASTSDRNDCIYLVKSAIDSAYASYRLRIARQVGLANEGLDIGAAASGAAATATTGVASKVLSGITSTLSGSRTAFNNDALYQQSLHAIFKQMEADRASTWASIQISMQAEVPDYTIGHANNDLLAYLEAGTVEDALNSLDANAGTADTTCKAASAAVSAVRTANGVAAASRTAAGNGGASASAVVQPLATAAGASPAATSTTEQCSQVIRAANAALGELAPKPDVVAAGEAAVSRRVKQITADGKDELDKIALALGAAVSADFATERGNVVVALNAITDPDKLADAVARIKAATGKDYSR